MTQKQPSSRICPSAGPMKFKKGVWYFVEIPSIPEQILEVEEAIAQTHFPEPDVFAVHLALDEALANAMKHGNDADSSKKVHVRFCIEDARITISVHDEGRGFDYTCIPDPTQDDRLDLPCGRGLLLMKSYMDSVSFNKEGNEVTMVKNRGESREPDKTT
jgi:serine/threonine-protein kinase RsbW